MKRIPSANLTPKRVVWGGPRTPISKSFILESSYNINRPVYGVLNQIEFLLAPTKNNINKTKNQIPPNTKPTDKFQQHQQPNSTNTKNINNKTQLKLSDFHPPRCSFAASWGGDTNDTNNTAWVLQLLPSLECDSNSPWKVRVGLFSGARFVTFWECSFVWNFPFDGSCEILSNMEASVFGWGSNFWFPKIWYSSNTKESPASIVRYWFPLSNCVVEKTFSFH